MHQGTASDEVTDTIAMIEMHRQEVQKETGLTAACNEALRKLHELLAHEKEALQQSGPDSGHAANVAAVTDEIQRVKNLAAAKKPPSSFKHERPRAQPASQPSGARNPARNRGRRTTGRRGDR